MFDVLAKAKCESLILLKGDIVKLSESQQLIKSCSYQHIEFLVSSYEIVSTPKCELPFEDYLNSFKYGSPPHAGAGLGLERVLSLYLRLDNVKLASLFPRDPNRIRP